MNPNDLHQLQNLIKRDPGSYKEEVRCYRILPYYRSPKHWGTIAVSILKVWHDSPRYIYDVLNLCRSAIRPLILSSEFQCSLGLGKPDCRYRARVMISSF